MPHDLSQLHSKIVLANPFKLLDWVHWVHQLASTSFAPSKPPRKLFTFRVLETPSVEETEPSGLTKSKLRAFAALAMTSGEGMGLG